MAVKTLQLMTVIGLAALSLQAAKPGKGNPTLEEFESVSLMDARREIGGANLQQTPAAMWIWSDKYVYRPGENLTLRWTLKPNNDFYPYTIFAYRVNNQTGAKSFIPRGTSEVTDVFGNTASQGYRITRLPSATKQILLGEGGLLGGAVTIPNELGMHTLIVELRDFEGGRVIKTSYWKIGVVDGEDVISGEITSNRTLVNTRLYRLSGIVYVKNNATLTIQPGTFIFGNPGSQPPSVLVITRNGRIVAEGTRARPIIMTSSLPFGRRNPGDWGGLILLGNARVNIPAGFGNVEGIVPNDDTRYGGTDDNHNCGSLRYVRVEFAGVALDPNNEVNAFTWSSCGRQTKSEFLQAHYGFDDSFEWFGGTNDGKYFVSTYGYDDYFDWQLGWTGRLQYGVATVDPNALGNMGIEADNNNNPRNATPVSNPTVANLTFVGGGNQGRDETNVAAVFLRRATEGIINNVISINWANSALRIVDAETLAAADAGRLRMNGHIVWNNGILNNRPNTLEGQVDASALPYVNGTRGQFRQTLVADPMLRRPLEYSDPDFRPMPGSPVYRANWILMPDDGFFDQAAKFIGAFGDFDWTEEWTTFITETDIRP